ncbi:MAG: serpin family protein [Eubacteriales bacterium]
MKQKLILIFIFIIIATSTACNKQSNKNDLSTNNNLLEDLKTEFDNLSKNKISEVYAESDDLASQVDRDVINLINRFAFDLYKELEKDDEKNIFISPYSISSALTMLYNGADTTTKEEIAKVLHYDETSMDDINETYKNLMISLLRADADVKINVANSTWIRDTFKPKENYIDVLEDYFFSEVYTKDFNNSNTVDEINQWISNATDDMISKMINEINIDTVMYLINAIYFKGDWTKQFDENRTKKEDFFSIDKTTEVDMMHQFEEFDFFQNDELIGVELPYGRERISMYAFVPQNDNNDIETIISNLDYDKFNEMFGNFREYENVEVKFPKFKVDYGVKELKNSLKSLGMEESFTNDADLTKIENDLFVSSVSHKAVIEVNEKGSEAAAATVVDITTESMPIEDEFKPVFIADQPFFFVIRDNYTGVILFMGKIGDLE